MTPTPAAFEFSLQAMAHASYGQWERAYQEIDAALAQARLEERVKMLRSIEDYCGWLQAANEEEASRAVTRVLMKLRCEIGAAALRGGGA